LLTGLKSLGLRQSKHSPKAGESLNRISIAIVPDPFFARLPTQKKKAVWLCKTISGPTIC